MQAPYERGRVKGSLFDGGTHVPLIVAGKGVTRRGERETALVNSTDLFATIADLAGIEQDVPPDSISFAPLLGGTGDGQRSYTYVELFGDTTGRGNNRRARQYGWGIGDGQWRYLDLDRQGAFLFDHANDPFETDNLLDGDLSSEAQSALERLKSQGESLRASD